MTNGRCRAVVSAAAVAIETGDRAAPLVVHDTGHTIGLERPAAGAMTASA